eukprot:Nk52_evm11s1129 gene=Nk52_evmTU11s1129
MSWESTHKGTSASMLLLNYLRGPVRRNLTLKVVIVLLFFSAVFTYTATNKHRGDAGSKIRLGARGSLEDRNIIRQAAVQSHGNNEDGTVKANTDTSNTAPEISEDEMGKMKNETLRKILGRSTWTLLHTMAARLPFEEEAVVTDTSVNRLKDFIYSLQHLYPCGECATNFQQNLKKVPPPWGEPKGKTNFTKNDYILWLCKIHNVVNLDTGKPQFPCELEKLNETWQCGCRDKI